MDRAGEVAVITGASGGIGRALAVGFSRDGTRVVALARDEARLRETAALGPPGMIDPIVGDVGSEADVERLFAHALGAYGRVDILVNNAAVYPKGMIAEQAPEEWAGALRTNVVGPFLCARKALPAMMERGRGRIINLGSFAGRNPLPGTSAYSVSKAAMICLTQAIAVEIDRERYPDILVNELVPGFVKTGMHDAGADPMEIYPHARALADLPAGGPTGRIFIKGELYEDRGGLKDRIRRKLKRILGAS